MKKRNNMEVAMLIATMIVVCVAVANTDNMLPVLDKVLMAAGAWMETNRLFLDGLCDVMLIAIVVGMILLVLKDIVLWIWEELHDEDSTVFNMLLWFTVVVCYMPLRAYKAIRRWHKRANKKSRRI